MMVVNLLFFKRLEQSKSALTINDKKFIYFLLAFQD